VSGNSRLRSSAMLTPSQPDRPAYSDQQAGHFGKSATPTVASNALTRGICTARRWDTDATGSGPTRSLLAPLDDASGLRAQQSTAS
jgi:hypothetical protein